MISLEELVRSSSRALVVGVGGGGDVVGALATARFLEFCGLEFILGGLSWERNVYDPIPGPRKLSETRNVRVLHPFAWMANGCSTRTFRVSLSFRGPGIGSYTFRSQESPPRMNSKPQNSRKRAVAKAPTTSPPPPTPTTRAREAERTNSSKEIIAQFVLAATV